MMAGIRSKNTKPEIVIRRGLHRKGFRYRLHKRDLPGKPDLYFPKYRAAIFVNGCFWHGHACPLFKIPKTRTAFWVEKIAQNVARDEKNRTLLEQLGIRHCTVWECQTRGKAGGNVARVIEECAEWLKSDNSDEAGPSIRALYRCSRKAS